MISDERGQGARKRYFSDIPVKYGGQGRRRRAQGSGLPGDNTQKCAVVVCMFTVTVSFYFCISKF